MKRPWPAALVLAACLAVLCGAMAWVSGKVLELDRAERAARALADSEERVRLALWRMESAIGPLLAEESARPYFTYAAFYPTQRAYDNMLGDFTPGELLLPSPLLGESPPLTRIHFQLDESGPPTSPQAPEGRALALTLREFADEAALQPARERFAALCRGMDFARLHAALGEEIALTPSRVAITAPSEPVQQRGGQVAQVMQQQAEFNKSDFEARRQTYSNMTAQRAGNRLLAPPPGVSEGLLRPVWFEGELLLLRRVRVNDRVLIQGCQLDWPAIRTLLCGAVADLLPAAMLEPVTAAQPEPGERRMAALPVRLLPGAVGVASASRASPLLWSLGFAWGGALLAAVAAAALLMGALTLAERRAAFVSAVTHELRTPLTAFRLYTELLADGRVTDPQRQQLYFTTMHTEARRLEHLVENVLAFARLEGGRSGARLENLTPADLYERVRPRLEQRAAQAGAALLFTPEAAFADAYLRVDVAAVEQILFNLVDNACKYAVGRGGSMIRVEVERRAGLAFLRVRDDGPGISPREARRLFRAFHKSAEDAAHSAPGVGLGLALCRRLARGMGGDLRLDRGSAPGACFVLSMPVAAAG